MNLEKIGDETFLCTRCLKILKAGKGDFFEIRVLAVKDPSTSLPNMRSDLARIEYEKLVQESASLSPGDAIDGVAQSRTFCLCDGCLEVWIENPCN